MRPMSGRGGDDFLEVADREGQLQRCGVRRLSWSAFDWRGLVGDRNQGLEDGVRKRQALPERHGNERASIFWKSPSATSALSSRRFRNAAAWRSMWGEAATSMAFGSKVATAQRSNRSGAFAWSPRCHIFFAMISAEDSTRIGRPLPNVHGGLTVAFS